MQESCFASGVRVGISNFHYMVGLCVFAVLLVSERDMLSLVRLSVVCNARAPYSGDLNFWQYF